MKSKSPEGELKDSDTIEIYHVDRGKKLSQGQFVNYRDSPENLRSQVIEIVNEYYPEGISRHGEKYLTTVEPNEFTNYLNEWVFEFVRMTEFPERPSRFQSVFGTETVENAREFANQFWEDEVNIWKIECIDSCSFRGDMSWLGTQSFPDGIWRSREYWNGNSIGPDPTWEIFGKLPVKVVELMETTNQ